MKIGKWQGILTKQCMSLGAALFSHPPADISHPLAGLQKGVLSSGGREEMTRGEPLCTKNIPT